MKPMTALVALLLLGGTPAMAKPKAPPCDAGRYLLAAPLVAGQAAPPTDAIEAGASRVAIGTACAGLAPKRFKAAATGTKVKAVWPACTGFTGRVKLTATIGDGCTVLRGKVKTKRFRARVQGSLSTCGDGRIDAAGGEDCDPPGATCPASCRRPASLSIGAGGGRITSADGRLTLDVPPGALAADTAIAIRRLATDEIAASLGPVDAAYDLGPDGLQFQVPVPVTFQLDPPATPNGELALTVGRLATASAGGGVPEPVADQQIVVDGPANQATATGTLRHFTQIASGYGLRANVSINATPGTRILVNTPFDVVVAVRLLGDANVKQDPPLDVAHGDVRVAGAITYDGPADVTIGQLVQNQRLLTGQLPHACGASPGPGTHRGTLAIDKFPSLPLALGIECVNSTTTSTRRSATTSTSRRTTTTSSSSSTSTSSTTVTTTTATSTSATSTTSTSSTTFTTTTTSSTLPRSNCCDCPQAGRCASGRNVRPADCTDFGCVFVANAECTASDECGVFTSSSSSTTSSTTSTTAGGSSSVSSIPVEAPEALSILDVAFFGPFAPVEVVVLVAGQNGWAIVDGLTGQPLVVAALTQFGPALFVAAPLGAYGPELLVRPSATEPPDLQGVIQAGPSGPAITPYDQTKHGFGFTQVFPGNPPCLDAMPTGGDPLSGEMLLPCATRVQTLVPDATFKFFTSGPTYTGFPQSAGPVFSAFRRRAGGPIVAITNGTPGRILQHPGKGTVGETAEDIGPAGNSPRRIRCAGNVCAVSNFASDSLTILTWSAQDVVDIIDGVTVGDGPVGIDMRPRTDGNLEVVSTGINDDSYSVTVLQPNGSTVSNQKRDVPEGCTRPGHVVWGSGRQVIMTCNGSDAIARAQAP